MTDILFEWELILCDTTSLENGKQLLSYKEYSVYRERHLVQKKFWLFTASMAHSYHGKWQSRTDTKFHTHNSLSTFSR